jgi:hypothetical protein
LEGVVQEMFKFIVGIVNFVLAILGGIMVLVGLFFPFLATNFFTRPPKTIQDLLAIGFFTLVMLGLGGFLFSRLWHIGRQKKVVDLTGLFEPMGRNALYEILLSLPVLSLNHRELTEPFTYYKYPHVALQVEPGELVDNFSIVYTPKENGEIFNNIEAACAHLALRVDGIVKSPSYFRAELDNSFRIHTLKQAGKKDSTGAITYLWRIAENKWLIFYWEVQ